MATYDDRPTLELTNDTKKYLAEQPKGVYYYTVGKISFCISPSILDCMIKATSLASICDVTELVLLREIGRYVHTSNRVSIFDGYVTEGAVLHCLNRFPCRQSEYLRAKIKQYEHLYLFLKRLADEEEEVSTSSTQITAPSNNVEALVSNLSSKVDSISKVLDKFLDVGNAYPTFMGLAQKSGKRALPSDDQEFTLNAWLATEHPSLELTARKKQQLALKAAQTIATAQGEALELNEHKVKIYRSKHFDMLDECLNQVMENN